MAVVIEFIGFNAITVILGRISGIYAAAQNIVCTITSVSFMIPFAISNATAVKVGFANGAKYYELSDPLNWSRYFKAISKHFTTKSALYPVLIAFWMKL